MTNQDDESVDPPRATDAAVRAVATLLPFPVDLDADMGYTGALFIDLGRRGGVDDPPDTASIDSEVEPTVWVFDVEGGSETIASGFGVDADPAEVARWIADQAYRTGSPAVITRAGRASSGAFPSSSGSGGGE